MTPNESATFGGYDLEAWALPAILLTATVVMLPMFIFGVPDGFDLLQHIRFAVAYHDAILSGEFIPAWAANDNFGYGSIGIRYYPPVAYILLAAGKIVSGSWYYSFIANSFMWMLAGCVGVYLWAREWVDVRMAVFAASLYAIAPYHTFQIYQAVLFAEFAAAGIIPFCFLYLTRVCRNPNWRDTLRLAVAASLLVLTHIPSTIIGALGLGVYALFIIDRSKFAATIKHLSAAAVAVMLATSFHWIKLVTETSWVLHNTPSYYSTGYYDYQRYMFPMYLIAPAERYVQRLLWHLDVVIVLTILFAVPAVFLVVTRMRRPKAEGPAGSRILSLAAVFVSSVLMLSLASSFIWRSVSFLAKLQFPWRWLLVSTVVGPILFVSAASVVSGRGTRPGRTAVYLSTVFVLSLALFSLTQNALLSSSLSKDKFDTQVAGMNDLEACPCWWPVWAKPEAFKTRERVSVSGRGSSVVKWEPQSRTMDVGEGEAGDVRISTFYHPYWYASVNGTASPVAGDPSGAITLNVPTEASRVELTFREPSFHFYFKAWSLLAWMGLLAALTFDAVRRRRSGFLT